MIYDHISADRLLGCLIKDTSLANSEKYSLCKEDFQTQFQKNSDMLLSLIEKLRTADAPMPKKI